MFGVSAEGTMTGVSPSDLRDKVVDVRMDDGAYRLVTETISFEIFADYKAQRPDAS